MNFAKNFVALLLFGSVTLYLLFFGDLTWNLFVKPEHLYFVASGFIGLGVGDLFLLLGFVRLGAARCLLIYTFQPLIMGFLSYLVFGQKITALQGLGILFLMATVVIMSLEKFREQGQWEVKGFVFALTGIILDNLGVIMTRTGFDAHGLNAMPANFIRCLGALAGVTLILLFSKEKIFSVFNKLTVKDRSAVVLASVFGTFLSLSLWLTAIRNGNLATLAAMSCLIPLASAGWDWLFFKKRPTRYFSLAVLVSAVGLAIVLL